MATCDDPLILLPYAEEKSSVYVCVPVDPELVTRSVALAGLMETGGLAHLPQGVTSDKFRTWHDMPMDDLASQDAAAIFEALEVADRLGDEATSQMAEALAQELVEVDWDDPSAMEKQELMSSLTEDLQRQVMQHMPAAFSSSASKWPLGMRLAYFDGIVAAPAHTLTISSYPASGAGPQQHRDALTLLALTAPSYPGLQSLTLRTPVDSGATANLVVAALAHHALSLSALTLPPLSVHPATDGEQPPTSAAIQILTTLPRLSVLTNLVLAERTNDQPPPDAPMDGDIMSVLLASLASAIAALPHLAHVSLRSFLHSPDVGCSTPNEHGNLSFDAVIAALSTAPALTSLTLFAYHSALHEQLPCSGIVGPFTSLRQLNLHHQLLSCPEAGRLCARPVTMAYVPTLPSLQSLTQTLDSTSAMRDSVTDMISNARRQPGLRTASFNLKLVAREPLMDFSADLAGLTQVTGLSVALQPAAGLRRGDVRTVARRLAALTALQSLHLKLDAPLGVGTAAGFDLFADNGALAPLRALTQLQELAVDVEGRRETVHDGAMCNCNLGSFTNLTALELRIGCMNYFTIPGPPTQFPARPRLQSLRIHSLLAAWTSSACLQMWLAPLAGLTTLEVSVARVDAVFVRALVDCVAGLSLLQRVEVRSRHACSEWLPTLRGLPVERGAEYVFACGSVRRWGAHYNAVRRLLLARGGRMPPLRTAVRLGRINLQL